LPEVAEHATLAFDCLPQFCQSVGPEEIVQLPVEILTDSIGFLTARRVGLALPFVQLLGRFLDRLSIPSGEVGQKR